MEEQLYAEKDEGFLSRGSDGESEASLGGEFAAAAKCACCGDGMTRDVVPRFSRPYGITILILGLLLSMFMSLLLGLPMVVIGAYMGAANRAVWMCRACGAVVDRIGN